MLSRKLSTSSRARCATIDVASSGLGRRRVRRESRHRHADRRPRRRRSDHDRRAGRREVRHARLAVRHGHAPRARPTPASPTRRSRSATATTPATRPRPGSTRRCRDAVKPMIKWCNDQGGINGRKIVGKYYDAQVLQVTQAMTQACNDKVFMLVGQGFVLDANQETDAHRLQALDDPRLRGRHRVRERFGHAAADSEPRRRGRAVVGVPGREAVPRRGEEGGVRVRRLPRDPETRDKAAVGLPEGGLEVPQLRPALQHRRASPTGSRSPAT